MRKISLLFIFTCAAVIGMTHAQKKILFVRGGSGTVGFFEGGDDEHAADITNYMTNNGNHGWGTLADTLTNNGYVLEQMIEGPITNNTPIDLANIDLEQYAVIVFGSNNADYPQAAIDSFTNYIFNGGGAVFISDANFGTDWSDASDSDQLLIDTFGWTMNQDRGTYVLDADDYNEPDHPILAGVISFDGEGVTPITLSNSNVPNVVSTIIVDVPSNQTVRRNDSDNQGSTTPSTADDAVLIVAQAGLGRIAGHYDRNTFFNENGAGTNINRFDNAQYAINLFNWLSCGRDVNEWTGESGLWNDSFNWSLGRLPNACDQVIINGINENVIVNVQTNEKIIVYDLKVILGKIELDSGAILEISRE